MTSSSIDPSRISPLLHSHIGKTKIFATSPAVYSFSGINITEAIIVNKLTLNRSSFSAPTSKPLTYISYKEDRDNKFDKLIIR